MTLLLPDGTPWTGTAEAKAAFGPGVGFFNTSTPISATSRSPQEMMKRAQLAFHLNPWVGTAETVVTRRVVGLPWHFEDGNDEEYTDDPQGKGVPTPPEVKTAQLLMERPQMALPTNARRPGVATRRLMLSLTCRHLGLCGMAYWYGDQMDVRGIPLAWLYINPARMWPAEDAAGNLTGWVLDPQDNQGHGGTPLDLLEVLPFYLDPPDWGNLGTGLYQRAMQKASVTNAADMHAGYVLGTGGRIAGIVSPREGTIPDEKFQALVREFRNVNEAPDAAKRTTILQSPVDFTPTAADPDKLNLVELTKMNRDDIFTIWGVPGSQAPVEIVGGMNSGETKGYDEAMLMQGAVHDRVTAISETLQFGWLDRYLPTVIDLEIVEPTFDDEAPAYALLKASISAPLTNAQRLEIIGKPPTGDPAIDNAILLPNTSVLWATAPSGDGPGVIEPKAPAPTFGEPAAGPPAKAKTGFLRLRETLDAKLVPATKRAVEEAFAAQRSHVVAWIRSHAAHLARKPGDTAWWNADKEDERLTAALAPHVQAIARRVTKRIPEMLPAEPAKAEPVDGWTDAVALRVNAHLIKRVKGMNQYTRDLIIEAIRQGIEDGLSMAEVGDLIEASTGFSELRAETIARTETMFAYNQAALDSYREYGVELVEALDGDEDDECIARQSEDTGYGPGIYEIDAASGIEEHPNGTLDWAPYFAPGKAAPTRSIEPPPDPPLPVAAPINITVGGQRSRIVFERDEYGHLTAIRDDVE